MDAGLDNMGSERAHLALPALDEIGLGALAAALKAFLEVFDDHVPKTQEEKDRYFAYCKQVFARLGELRLHDIPERLDLFLAKP